MDYVAAKHVNADAIIHFGDSCNSELIENEIPVLKINPKILIDYQLLSENLSSFQKEINGLIYLVFSQKYSYLTGKYKILFQLCMFTLGSNQ